MSKPSRFSPEFFKPQKPENHSCCGGQCATGNAEIKVIQKRGCFIRYNAASGTSYKAGGGASHKSC